MADTPQYLTLRHNRDGTARGLHARRTLLVLVTAFLLAGVANVFGQRPSTATARTPVASLAVYSPSHVRSGLYFEARFHIAAHADVKDARLVLGTGWLEGITINTIEPSPLGEASRDGRLALDLGHIPAGSTYLLFVQMQVNPTNVGRRPQLVELYDGDALLASLTRTITVFP